MIKKISLFCLIAVFSLVLMNCAGFLGMKTPEALKGYNFTTIEQIAAMEAYPEFYFKEGPAQYLITKQEKKIWKKIKKIKDVELRDSTQKEFLKWFWERRDPSPFNPANEFKEQFYAYIIYAQKSFRQEAFHRGYLSDRGKIFLILGAPDWERATSPGLTQNQLEEQNPNLFFDHDRTSEILVWYYK